MYSRTVTASEAIWWTEYGLEPDECEIALALPPRIDCRSISKDQDASPRVACATPHKNWKTKAKTKKTLPSRSSPNLNCNQPLAWGKASSKFIKIHNL